VEASWGRGSSRVQPLTHAGDTAGRNAAGDSQAAAGHLLSGMAPGTPSAGGESLVGLVMEAYVNGVSTRKMLRVVQELGLEGMDKSKVPRINKELD